MLPKDYSPELYPSLLKAKIDEIWPAFEALGAPTPDIFPSPIHSFRMRAEFRVWHEGDALDFVMFDPTEPKKPIVIEDFPFASDPIRQLLAPLRAALRIDHELRYRLFQIELLSSLSGDLLITLIYHRRLDDSWEQAALSLSNNLGVKVVGRSKGQKVVLSEDWVNETLCVNAEYYHFKQPEQAFIQPNASVNEAMLSWAVKQIPASDTDLLELYCGIGNFTIPLSANYRRVLATEVSKVATRAAVDNLDLNGVTNVAFARLSAEEMTQALTGTRAFRRLASLEYALPTYDFDTIFVDPPRAGLDRATLELTKGFKNILYISCNPLTLLDNMADICGTHTITSVGFFDQFPYTKHLECGVYFTQRKDNEAAK